MDSMNYTTFVKFEKTVFTEFTSKLTMGFDQQRLILYDFRPKRAFSLSNVSVTPDFAAKNTPC